MFSERELRQTLPGGHVADSHGAEIRREWSCAQNTFLSLLKVKS